MNTRITTLSLALVSLFTIQAEDVKLTVTNPNSIDRSKELVELDAAPILKKLGTEFFTVVSEDQHRAIPAQLTHDGKIIFSAGTKGSSTNTFTIRPSMNLQKFPSIVTGRIHPERADDLAWENELVGFRVYGPATQKRGERSFGYDIFLKYTSELPVLDILYDTHNASPTWRRIEALRKEDKATAQQLEHDISYHNDHGLGMDCYAVGATLGDGVAAPYINNRIDFPWCYETIEILDNGPLRFTAKLNFAPRKIGTDSAIVEHRIISLDCGSHLNRTAVWYDGLTTPMNIVTGFPRRDDGEAFTDTKTGIAAYVDPTQGKDNGKIFVGIIIDNKADKGFEAENHILLQNRISPNQTHSYRWGFAWSRTDIQSLAVWKKHLQDEKNKKPLKVSFL